MRICHLITRMVLGGAQENTLLTVQGLLRQTNHQVHLAFGPELDEGSLLDAACQTPGLHIHRLRWLRREMNPVWDALAYRELTEFFERHQFDLVHTHSSKAGILGRFAAGRIGVNYVVHTVHGLAFDEFASGWKRSLFTHMERAAASQCDRIIAVSRDMADRLHTSGILDPEAVEIIQSGFDLSSYLDISHPSLDPDRCNFGVIARMVPMKGHEALMNLIPRVCARLPQSRWLIVGDGPMMADWRSWSLDHAAIQERVEFTGRVPPSEIPGLISRMDILVHLSVREGLPRVVAQALAAGRPAIAYDVGGTRELVLDQQTGFLLCPGDLEGVERAILNFVRNPSLVADFGSAGRRLVTEQFDDNQMVTRIIKLYQSLDQ
jgi:glycosyltransferase involved in cell wall biosynthesis